MNKHSQLINLTKESEHVKKAKKCVENHYKKHFRGTTKCREWLSASPPDSYQDSDYRVTVHVLSGSPPKGYVLSNKKRALALSMRFKFIHKFQNQDVIYI